MRLLVLYPSAAAVRGPMPKVTPPLIVAVRRAGWPVAALHWGRRRDQEHWRLKTVSRLGDLARAARSMQRGSPDLVVVVTAHDLVGVLRDLPLVLTARLLRRSTVLFFHGSRPEQAQRGVRGPLAVLSRALVRLADGVLVLSTEERRGWERIAPGCRVRTVRNPTVQAYSGMPVNPPGSWGLPNDVPVLLFAGRLIEEKGIHVLVEAIARLRDVRPVHLLVVGEGPARGEVARQVAAYGLHDRVTLAGYVNGPELDAAYRSAMALVLPTWWPEGMPSVFTEAMPYGLPIITTPVRGAVDHLTEGVNALFVPPRDPEALAQAMERLLADASLRERMSAANKMKATAFSPEAAAAAFMQALEEIRAHRRGLPAEQRGAPRSLQVE